MRDGWTKTTLGEVAIRTIGRTPPRNDPSMWTTGTERPFVTIADLAPNRSVTAREGISELAERRGYAKRFSAGSLLLSFKLSIGRIGIADRDVFTNEAIARLVPNDGVSRDYLALALESVNWDGLGGRAVKGKTMNKSSLDAVPITLPTLVEQRRIVDLIAAVDYAVDAAEAEATAHDEAVSRLRELTPAAPLRPLSELIDSIDSGLSLATPTSEATGARLLRVSAVRHGRFDAAEHKRTGAAVLPDRARVHAGDVLMTRSNTPDRVGFVAQVDESGDGSYMPDLIWRLMPKAHLSPAYLVQVLSSPRGREEIMARASGTSASMQKVSKGRVRTITIPDASPEAQAAYVAPIAAAQAGADAARETAESLRTLRGNLLTVLVSGEHEIPSSYDTLLEEVA